MSVHTIAPEPLDSRRPPSPAPPARAAGRLPVGPASAGRAAWRIVILRSSRRRAGAWSLPAGSSTGAGTRSPTTPSSRPTSSTSPRRWSRAGSSASWSTRTTGSSRARCWPRSTRSPTATRSASPRRKLDAAEAELARQQADLERLRKEVPIQIEIARRTLAAAEADRAKAEESLKLTRRRRREGHRRGPRRRQGREGRPDAGRAGVRPLHAALPARRPRPSGGSRR